MAKDHAAAYFDRKGHYSLQMLAFTNEQRRFIGVHMGWGGAVSDARIQKATPFRQPDGNDDVSYYTDIGELCAPNEFILGDSGMVCTEHMIAMYKRRPGRQLEDRQVGPNLLPFRAPSTTC